MNRYPLWVYVTVAVAVVLGLLYTLPNFFGESPAVQVSSAKSTLKVDTATMARVEETLKEAGVAFSGATVDQVGVKVRFADTDTQLKAKDILSLALNPDAENPSFTVGVLEEDPDRLPAVGLGSGPELSPAVAAPAPDDVLTNFSVLVVAASRV